MDEYAQIGADADVTAIHPATTRARGTGLRVLYDLWVMAKVAALALNLEPPPRLCVQTVAQRRSHGRAVVVTG